ncbi:MAG TPA: helix-turn-helix domain-containing protein [Rhizomicrobium sp.]|jgi:AraC-like DNA-binding protein
METLAGPPGMSVADIYIMLGADGRSESETAALLRAHGISASPSHETLISADVCFRLFAEHAALVEDETHGVFGNRLKPGGTKLMIARMLLCETILDALRAYAEAASIIVPELAVTVVRRRDGVCLIWRSRNSQSELHQIVLEGTAAVFYAIFCWLAGDILPVSRVRAPRSRKHAASTLLQMMGAPVLFSGNDLEIVFAPAAATRRVRNLDIGGWRDGTYRVFSAAVLRSRDHSERGGAFSDEVRAAMLDGLDQQALADRLGVSTKTVARRLEREGHSFREIRDEVRKQKSTSLIHAELTVEEIGEILDYEDPRSFRRAFQRWFGQSPSVYRKERRAH